MEYKTPKVLEKKPIVMGFDLITVVIIVICAMLFVFILFTNFLISLLFPLVAIGYVLISKKYPRNGELMAVLKYQSGVQCIRFNQQIKNLVIKRAKE